MAELQCRIRTDIEHLLSGNRTFSLVVAMESALADKRWEVKH